MTTKDYDPVDAIIRYEEGELGDTETLALFAHLVSTGQAWQLQGHYGRVASELINDGWLDADGNVLREVR